jgi:hypothetical protein
MVGGCRCCRRGENKLNGIGSGKNSGTRYFEAIYFPKLCGSERPQHAGEVAVASTFPTFCEPARRAAHYSV